ncbi:MAG: FAD-dependent oxidoreductase [Haloarculaceae archaeon]
MTDPDAVVVGGGIVGSAVAYHLARDGHETVLVDREDEGRATDAGAGILSPPTSSRNASDDWFRLAAPAVQYYPELADELREAGVEETGYTQCGLLAVAMDEEAVATFEATERRLRERQATMDYPPDGTVRSLDPEAAVERFPALATPERALYYERGARVDGSQFEAALRAAGRRRGLGVRDATVERLRIEGGAVSGVETDEGRLAADTVVVAGGAWSSGFASQLGLDVPVEPVRGQIVHVETNAETGGWPVVTGFDHRYLVPWDGGRVAVGATDEDAGYSPHATVAGVHELLGTARSMAPGLDDARLGQVRAGLRPVAPDGLPLLGPVPSVDGAFLATGHGATGLQLGPYTGALVAALVDGRNPEVDLDAYRPGRF